MYKLKNWLFGWDYIAWQNPADNGVARIVFLKDGRVGYWRYRSISVFDEVKDPSQVFWLTCHPSKYFKNVVIDTEV